MKSKELDILLIEDDPDDQFFFKDALSQLNTGVSCRIAGNGIEALETLNKNPHPDLIFLSKHAYDEWF
jgi:CheY-like chemotaxis protein